MRVRVYDEEKMKKNDLVGETICFLQKIMSGETKQDAIEIMYNGKLAGTVYVKYEFEERASQQVGISLGGVAATAAANYA